MQPQHEGRQGRKNSIQGPNRPVAERAQTAWSGDEEAADPERGRRSADSPWARGLGWFSVALGACEILVPSQVAHLAGVDDTATNRLTLRLAGARELAAGVGLLRRRRSGPWLWSRVAGDVMDLAFLGKALRNNRRDGNRLPLAIAAVAGVTALDVWASSRARNSRMRDASSHAATVPAHASIIIERPASDLYAFWRDVENLPRFMSHIRTVEARNRQHSHWIASAIGRDDLEWDAIITEDRPHELIAWRSVGEADLEHAGEVRFIPASDGRRTEVQLTMNVVPPGGAVGMAIGKLIHRVPEQIIRGDLKRLKQLLETHRRVKPEAGLNESPRST
jgi:uncharacterized membrane protein